MSADTPQDTRHTMLMPTLPKAPNLQPLFAPGSSSLGDSMEQLLTLSHACRSQPSLVTRTKLVFIDSKIYVLGFSGVLYFKALNAAARGSGKLPGSIALDVSLCWVIVFYH